MKHGGQIPLNASLLDLGQVRRLDTLLEALEEGMPPDAVVYVEGAAFASDVRAALAALPSIPEEQRRTDLRGTLLPVPESFHIPVRSGVLGVLRELEQRHASPEVCTHVAVYRGNEILALAHDAADASLLVGRLARDAVEKMRRVVERDAATPRGPWFIDRVRRFLRRGE
ncbi:MAG TPA: hypothetical protein VFL83_08990 [Anaeromyxobacter sp.]|nr:hypothetical protein [Anaeromyxobacter sp.]